MTVTELKKLLEKAEAAGYGEAEVKRFTYALLSQDYHLPITGGTVLDVSGDRLAKNFKPRFEFRLT